MLHTIAARRTILASVAIMTIVPLVLAVDDAKKVIDAQGMTFEAPSSWKSTPPANRMRRAQLSVEPLEGDTYPAEMVVSAFPGGAGSIKDNLERWQNMFKDKDGKSPEINSKKVQGKNVEVTRAETAGHYHPAQFGGRVEPDRENARFLGAIIVGDDISYFIRMVGPDKTMLKLRPEFDALLASIKLEGK